MSRGISKGVSRSIPSEPRSAPAGSRSPGNSEPWFFLWSGPGEAAWNMAVDEWLLSTAHGRPPVLRLYGWTGPSVSLGRHEPWREVVDPGRLEASGVALVRRPTGGRAVLHDREITYSVTADLEGDGVWGDRLEATMARISGALARGLERLGVAASYGERGREPRGSGGRQLCFESTTRYELSSEGVKAVGSAQLRSERGFLQHGSIPTGPTLKRLWELGTRKGPCPADSGPPPGLQRCSGLPLEDLARALAAGFEEEFGIWGRWTGRESLDLDAVDNLVRSKYATSEWTFRR